MSGVTVLDIDMPSGYIIVQSRADNVVTERRHPGLRDVKVGPATVTWFFDSVSTGHKVIKILYQLFYV